jgi:hypothetical protein
MATAVATPQPSIPSSVAAPSVASPSTIQTAPVSSPMPQAPAYTPEAPVSAPQANPWQAAYQGLLASLSATPQSQPQAYSSVATQQVAPTPVAYQQAPTSYQAAPSVSAPLTSAFPQTQAYSQATQVQAPSYSSEQSAPASDEYLQNVSSESLEVLQHFGAEAPALLNRYACVVEDALLAQARQTAEALQGLQTVQEQLKNSHTVIEAAAEDNAAYHTLMTNPDMLADYVNEFFGPEGPYPTELPQDRLAAEVEANERRFAPAPATYQRPQLDMPAPDVQAGSGGDDFWATFSALSERNPAAAWQMLSQASPEALRSKVLVSEG